MPIKEKYLVISQQDGDQDRGGATYAYSNPCGEIKYFDALTVFFSKQLKQNPSYQVCDAKHYLPLVNEYNQSIAMNGLSKGIQPSDLTIIYLKAKQCIHEKNAPDLKKLLQTEFIYGPTTYSRHCRNRSDCSDSYDGAYYKVRPNLEALCIHHVEYFAELIDLLVDARDDALSCAFLTSLANTDFKNESFLLLDDQVFKFDRTNLFCNKELC